jgi:hypothetical protein
VLISYTKQQQQLYFFNGTYAVNITKLKGVNTY